MYEYKDETCNYIHMQSYPSGKTFPRTQESLFQVAAASFFNSVQAQ